MKIIVECINGHELSTALWIDMNGDLRLTVRDKCPACHSDNSIVSTRPVPYTEQEG